MAASIITTWQQKLIRRVKREPKKAMALTVLVAVMIVMWGKAVFTGKSEPGAAMASPGASAGIPEAASKISPQLPQTAKALQSFARGQAGPINRNLFLVKMDYFARDGSAVAVDRAAPDGFWDEVAKSMSAKADQEKARRILIENLQSQASRLDLQSTMMGNGNPKAMVNGTLVGEGDTVAGFRVVKIEPKRLIVEREGVKLEVVFRF